MDITSPVIALLILLLFGGIVYAVIASARKTVEKKRSEAALAGFTPIQPDAALTERISRVHDPKPGKFRLENVAHKHLRDGDAYLFDLIDTSDSETSYLEDQSLAVFSPGLNLPRFTLLPKVEEDGAPGRLANQVVRWVLSRSAPPLHFPDTPEFQARYMVSTKDAAAAQAFFSPTLRRRLAGTKMVTVKADQDGFIFSIFPKRGVAEVEELNRLTNQALDLLKWFEDESHG